MAFAQSSSFLTSVGSWILQIAVSSCTFLGFCDTSLSWFSFYLSDHSFSSLFVCFVLLNLHGMMTNYRCSPRFCPGAPSLLPLYLSALIGSMIISMQMIPRYLCSNLICLLCTSLMSLTVFGTSQMGCPRVTSNSTCTKQNL